jgi:hypothetical protein
MKSGEGWIVNSDFKFEQFSKKAHELYKQYGYVTFSWITGRQRTSTQNASLHLWCEMVAQCLNDAGLEMEVNIPDKTRKPWIVPWTKTSVKEQIWRPIQVVLTEKESTVDAERAEYGLIYETISRRFSESFGIVLPLWPDKDSQ